MTDIAPVSTKEMKEITEKLIAAEPLFAVAPKTVRGVDYERVFALSDMSLRDLLAVKTQEFASDEFMVFEGQRYTFAQSFAKACQFANVLIEKYDVKPGDRVAIAMRNYPEWCMAYIGIIAAGATVLPLNAWWKEDELCFALKDSGAKIVIGDKKRLSYLKPHQADLGLTLIAAHEKSDDANDDFQEMTEGVSTDMPAVQIDPDSDFCILYTSGSTGNPKGVLLTHRGVINAILSWSFLLHVLEAARPEVSLRPENPGTLLALPLFHVTASHSSFLLSYLSGRKIVFMYRWDVQEAIRLIKEEKLTSLSVVPTQSAELIDAAQEGDLDSLRDLNTGGAKRPAHHVKQLKDKFPNLSAGSGYGLTETNALACINGLQDYVERPESTGRAVPPVTEIKIFDPEMNELPVGEVGEVCIKSPANFRGYLGLPEETERALTSDGWFKTGDLGKLDEDGFLYIVDRLKELIIRGGENISCLEVENEIYKFGDIKEVTVFGIEDERLGEVVGAVIYAGDNEIDVQALHAFISKNMAGFKVPERIWISPQQLPRGGTGKIDKRTTKTFALQYPPHFKASDHAA